MTRPTKKDAVALFTAMMLSGEFIRGKTAKAYAKEHGVPLVTVQSWTLQASVAVKAAVSDEEFKAMAEQTLARLVDIAEQDGNVAGAVAALKLALENRGLYQQKHDVRVSPEQLTEEQLRAELLKHGLEVKELGE